jgi:hypothetical protein
LEVSNDPFERLDELSPPVTCEHRHLGFEIQDFTSENEATSPALSRTQRHLGFATSAVNTSVRLSYP